MDLKTKIDIIFASTTLIVATLLYVAFQNESYLKESSDHVNRTNNFLFTIESFESSIVQIEASSRGYIISGNNDFLNKLEQAKEEAYSGLKKIKVYFKENQQPEYLIDKLEYLANEKIKISELGVALRSKESIESAIELVSLGKGKELMDEIVSIIKDIEKEEFDLLAKSINENKVHAVNQNNMYKLLSLLIFSILLIFHFFIRKNTFKELTYKEQQAKLIKELNHQNKQLDDFVHIITHNVRSPANNITSLISLIDEKSKPDEVQFILDKLRKVSSNLNETLNELLEVIRIKQDTSIPTQTLYFKEVFDKVVESFQGDILSKNATLSFNFDECPTINYPKPYLESIAQNLISNALKYSSSLRKPEITITSHYIQGSPVLKVADNGLGMDLKKIGDKLFGLRKVFHTTENAKGIGLFMTKTHIETMGGEIKVDSEVEKGTTFTIYFKKIEAEKEEIKPSHQKIKVNEFKEYSL